MSKIRTVDAFLDSLDQESSWRVKELHDIKLEVKGASGSRELSLIRAGVPLAYAHWEGFVKASVAFYFDFITGQKIKMKDLKPCLVAFAKKGRFYDFAESNRFDVYSQIVRELTEQVFLDEKARFPRDFRTGNLKSEVFSDIAKVIGVGLTQYEPRFTFMDVRLLKRRNEIAHGSYLDLDKASFLELVDDVLALLRMFKTDLSNQAVAGGFRR